MKQHKTITLAHGSGGRATHQLITQIFHTAFNNEFLQQQNDAASFAVHQGRLAISTDAHVITPLFFPGGNIGSLAVHGAINDVAMLGAKPLYLTASFILEEGFALADLQAIVHAMAEAAQRAKVAIIAGDTKVVEKGKGDGVFISTTAVGEIAASINISAERAQVGDHIIISGDVGDHGVAIMAFRENLDFATQLHSDSAALHELVANMLQTVPEIHCLRDPTRGGVATALNELAQQSQVGMLIHETQLPIKTAVMSACELLGLDPLYIANEGKLIAICPAQHSAQLLACMQQHPLGKNAAIIGEVIANPQARVQMQTQMGGMRTVDWLLGEQLPRIC
jgi:hydrogenase expression/formation protein HypE